MNLTKVNIGTDDSIDLRHVCFLGKFYGTSSAGICESGTLIIR